MVEIESFRDFEGFEPPVAEFEALFVNVPANDVVAPVNPEPKPKPASLVKKEN